jgi:tRNA U38,U39,U40 pseudouridine synthase TruA
LSNVYQVNVYKADLNRSAEVAIPNGNRSGRTDAAVHALADAFEADLLDIHDYEGVAPVRSVQFVTDVVTAEDVPQL